eukprot:COSAG06_NODE_578_length_14043_cov_3.556153_10_plen_107_part_00
MYCVYHRCPDKPIDFLVPKLDKSSSFLVSFMQGGGDCDEFQTALVSPVGITFATLPAAAAKGKERLVLCAPVRLIDPKAAVAFIANVKVRDHQVRTGFWVHCLQRK